MSNTAKQFSIDLRILASRKVLDALNIKAVIEADGSAAFVEDPNWDKLLTRSAEVIAPFFW